MNWIVKGKILAFAGPSYKKNVTPEGYCTLSPHDYIPYFTKKQIGLVVRLNQKNYDEQQFIDAGIGHVEEFYTDGSCPHMSILQRVVASFEKVPKEKGFAVHCKAGLGRTGTCIGAYLMKHYKMTAKEVIGWMRICRPGMVIGPQQQFLEKIQHQMWQEGEAMRKHNKSAFSSPTKSVSTVSTAPNTPDSVVLSAAGSQDMGHEVVLTGDATNQYRYEPTPQDESMYEQEKIHGRPGQADGLLTARHKQQQLQQKQQNSTTPMNLSATDDDDSADGTKQSSSKNAVPVTPDNRESSIWARAFA